MDNLFRPKPLLIFRMFLLIVLSILMMILDKDSSHVPYFHNVLSTVVAPVTYGVNRSVQAISEFKAHFSNQKILLKDNANLRFQTLLLKAQLQRLNSLQQENKELKALLKSRDKSKEHVVVAELLATGPDPYQHEMILNKGSKHAVKVGLPVLDAHGVIGQVIETYPNYSRVLLISDARSSVPVQNVRTGLRAIAQGMGSSDQLRLSHVVQSADVLVDDEWVTSGLGLRYPVGYPVGKVSKIAKDPAIPFAQISLTAFSHLNKSRYFLIVWPNQRASMRDKQYAR